LTHSAPVLDLGLDLVWTDASGAETTKAGDGRVEAGG
jgi:hypothetical protein